MSLQVLEPPTPQNTPTSTPTTTSAQSPVRGTAGGTRPNEQEKFKKPTGPVRKKERKEQDLGLVLFAPIGSTLPSQKMTHATIVEYLKRSELMYIFQKQEHTKEQVKSMILQKKVDMGEVELYVVDKAKYSKLVNGQYLNLQVERFKFTS